MFLSNSTSSLLVTSYLLSILLKSFLISFNDNVKYSNQLREIVQFSSQLTFDC